jgi:hypothetical protein
VFSTQNPLHRGTPLGRYSLICFETDAHDGKPHLAKGMIKEFTIT